MNIEPLTPGEGESADVREVFNLFCITNWGSRDTSLGDLECWPVSLKAMVRMIFATDTPHCILWGADLVCIYNAAYWKHIARDKHPELMGMPASTAFQSTKVGCQSWDPWKHIAEAMNTHRPVQVPETLYLRQGPPGTSSFEEIYTSYRISTIYGDDCSPSGLLCVYYETTTKVLTERKARTLSSLVTATRESTTFSAMKVKLVQTMNDSALDFPLCQLVLRERFLTIDCKSEDTTIDEVTYHTFAAAGLKRGENSHLVHFNISEAAHADEEPLFQDVARRAHESRRPVTFQTDMFEETCGRRAFGFVSRVGRMYPIYADDSCKELNAKPLGYLMLAFSPVRPLDDWIVEYANIFYDLIKQAIQNFREVSRSQARLQEMNEVRKIGEQYFRVLHDLPVGISVQDWKAKELIFSNRRWKEILGHADDSSLDDWSDLVYSEDLPGIYEILSKLEPDGPPSEHVLRLKRLHSNGKPAWISVTCSFHREQLAEGQIVTLLTTAIHDTSAQVYAKEIEVAAMMENQRLSAARESEAQRADEADSAKGLLRSIPTGTIANLISSTTRVY